MSLSKFLFVPVGAVALAGAAVTLGIDPDRNQTPWTLEFDQPTLVEPAAFIAALDHASQRWERRVTIKESPTTTTLLARPDMTQIPDHPSVTPRVLGIRRSSKKRIRAACT